MGAGTAALSTSQKKEPGGAPFAAGAANNGLSVSPAGNIVLGNDAAGAAAALLSNREIPLGAFSLSTTGVDYLGTLHRIKFSDSNAAGTMLELIGENDSGSGTRIRFTDLETAIISNIDSGGGGLFISSNGGFGANVASTMNFFVASTGGNQFNFTAAAINTVTTNASYTLNGGFNNAAAEPTLLLLSLADGASLATSKLLNMLVNGVSVFSVQKDGVLTISDAGTGNDAVLTPNDLTITDGGSSFNSVLTSQALILTLGADSITLSGFITVTQGGLTSTVSGNQINSGGTLSSLNAASIVRSRIALTNYAAAALGTLTNAPTAGNPTKWIAIDDNGTIRKIPTWL